MIITTVVVAVGLLVGSWAAHTCGFRLGGVVVVPLVAVYTLFAALSLPIFVLSGIIAYIAIVLIQDRWLLYSRFLLLVAIGIGAVLPIGMFLSLNGLLAGEPDLQSIEFLGTILPGIAAYNFYRQDTERLLPDVAASVGLLGLTVIVGIVGLHLWVTPPCLTCGVVPGEPASVVTPVMLQSGSDVAVTLGYSTRSTPSTIGGVGTVTFVIVLGFLLGELVRARWSVRPLGVIALPLLALFALKTWWALPLYLSLTAGCYYGIKYVHEWTLLYGRVLLSVGIGGGLLASVFALVVFGLPYGLTVFFTGLLAGVGAYNFHVTAPWERRPTLAINAGLFVVLFGLARTIVSPLPGGLGESLGPVHVLVSLGVIVAALRSLYDYEQRVPSNGSIRSQALYLEEVNTE